MPKLTERKDNEKLQKLLVEYKTQLMNARVQDTSKSQQQNKTGQIRELRKNIARALTFVNINRREEAKKKYTKARRIPKELRPKKTRALRRALTKTQKQATSIALKKRTQFFVNNKFVVLA